MTTFPRKPRRYPSKPADVRFAPVCPSTFGAGVYHCQLTDVLHYDVHRDGATTWTDVAADPIVQAQAA